MDTFVLAIVATLAAGILRTSVGIGSGIFLTACLSLLFEPKMTLAIMAFLQIGLGASALGHYWGKWSTPLVLRLAGAVFVGVVLGSWLVTVLPAHWFRRLFGLGLAGLGLFELIRRPDAALGRTSGNAMVSGFLAGVGGSMVNAAGAILALHLKRLQLSYDTFLGTLSAVVMCTDVLRLGLYWQFGLLNGAALYHSILLLPLAFVGGWIGVFVRSHVPERILRQATLSLVIVIGIMLLM
ncbi:MAG: sulfite exporter TauE/SafE family protein [Hyphomonadaceae bacterium]|nr:sulfite exporter TauE/SafE family protein [Hyphomonadaceae bacterium]